MATDEFNVGRLTDRFIEFHSWSTAKKTVLLMGAGFVFQLSLSPVFVYLINRSGVGSARGLVELVVAGLASVLVAFALASVPLRRGRDGRWTAYFTVITYGAWLLVVFVSLGLWSTPVLGWALMVVILVGLWYDERVGWFATAYMLVLFAAAWVLTQTGALDYAPLLEDRSIDAQSSNAWFAAMAVPVLGFFTYTFAATLLTVRTRRAQEERLREAHELIQRYVPAGVAAELGAGDHPDGFGVLRAKLTIFFSDIEGFTDTSDQLDPEDLSLVLNQYLSEMAEIAETHGASINHFEGDGILIFFGAPSPREDRDNALQAINMAHTMQHRLAGLRERWRSLGIRAPLQARMGINTGYASVGDFGSPGRKVYTAVGVQVNVAARIQDHCPPGRVLISDSTWGLVKDDVATAEHGEVTLKGVHYPIAVYEAIDPHPSSCAEPTATPPTSHGSAS